MIPLQPPLPPGTRVRWIEEDPDDVPGTVVAPTKEELAYVDTWASTAQADIVRKVIVHWDGDEDWERAWHDPDELRVLP